MIFTCVSMYVVYIYLGHTSMGMCVCEGQGLMASIFPIFNFYLPAEGHRQSGAHKLG